MQYKHAIYHKLNMAIRWNVLGYTMQRIAYTTLSIYAYAHVPTKMYVTWTTCMSIMYMAIFLCDAGLRKSIPLYATDIHVSRYAWIYTIIGTLVASGMCMSMGWIVPYAHETGLLSMAYLVPVIVIPQSLYIGMRIMYTSYFYNKIWASVSAIWPTIESGISIWTITCTHVHPLWILIASKAACSVCAVTHAYVLSAPMTTPHEHTHRNTSTHTTYTQKMFVRHTAYMWAAAVLKSVSERNMIMSVLAWIAPPHLAAVYKVVLDAVILIYRTIIKGVDINDIALLRDSESRECAFFHISITCINWASLACISIPFLPYCIPALNHYNTLCWVVGYASMFEVMAMPWERIQEVLYKYTHIIVTYICMLTAIGISVYLISPITTYSHLVTWASLLYGIRLIGIWSLSQHAMYRMHIVYPWRYALMMLTLCIGMSACIILI